MIFRLIDNLWTRAITPLRGDGSAAKKGGVVLMINDVIGWRVRNPSGPCPRGALAVAAHYRTGSRLLKRADGTRLPDAPITTDAGAWEAPTRPSASPNQAGSSGAGGGRKRTSQAGVFARSDGTTATASISIRYSGLMSAATSTSVLAGYGRSKYSARTL